jgi:hypothetical protein
MGASTDQIDRQIKETRERMDENLGTLEERAANNAVRYGKIAAIVVAAALAGGAAFLIVRRLRKPTLGQRLQGMSPDAMRELAGELRSRIKDARKSMPSVTVTVNDKEKAEPGTLESIVRKVAPAVIGTASTAVVEKLSGSRNEEAERDAAYVRPAFD